MNLLIFGYFAAFFTARLFSTPGYKNSQN